MLLLSREEIRKIFTMKDAIAAVEAAFCMVSEEKCEVPIRTQIPVPKEDGCLLFMPAYAPELESASLKIINIFPKNVELGLTTSPAQTLLIDGKTGVIQAVLDGTYVTQLRTGAASGVAFQVLGRKEGKQGALIGTGSQAAQQLEAMLAVRQLKKVKVYARNKNRLDAFVIQMRKELASYQTEIVAAESSDDAIYDADYIILVTPSNKPVIDANKVKKGATISCVGSYQPQMQELDPNIFVRRPKLYFDSKEAVLSESGDILKPLEDGVLTENDFSGEIGEVLNGTIVGRESEEEIIVFKTVGVAAQDLVSARRIYDKAVAAGVGMNWE